MTKNLLIAIAITSVILPPAAYGYIDPGSGSMILQAVVAALLAGTFTIKLWWRKLISLFSKTPDKES